MEEIKTKGVILKSSDFGDADKIITLFSLEYGKISVKFSGVKKPKAKLKPLIQNFTFVELECIKRGDFYRAKTGSVISSFGGIVANYNKTICAYILMDIILKVLPKNKPETEIFLRLITALEELEEKEPYSGTIKFILDFFELLGEALNLKIDASRIYLDLNLGNFCESRVENCIEIDKKCYNNLSLLNGNDKLNVMCLKMLNNILKVKYDVELNSFSFL